MSRHTPLLAVLLAVSCSGGSALVPEFELLDVNLTSPSYDTAVSPSDQRGLISAWYFGHAT